MGTETRDIESSTSVDETTGTRRSFLGKMAVATVATAAAGVAAPAKALAVTSTGVRWGMVIDLRRCTGCKACAIACKAQFEVPLGVWRSDVKEVIKGAYPKTKKFFIPRLCNQCKEPPCVPVCPVEPKKATYVRESDATVQIDEKTCIGCGNCVEACPYGARFVHPDTDIAEKCNMCIERVDKGVVPSCVNGCPMKARVFGDLNDSNSEVARLIAGERVEVLKPRAKTLPSVHYIPVDRAVTKEIRDARDRINKD